MNTREIGCEDLGLAIEEFAREGFRLEAIYPADDPKCAVLSRASDRVRLALPDAPAISEGLPHFVPQFVVSHAGRAPSDGRAGMLYRDLIPGRLGGRYIASHITIEKGGPVADWVHYHRIALQIIVVRRGWVRVVYEGEGEPFVMEPGDMVLQPPFIRHRVLESSPGLEVIEISAPALHETFADHEIALPGGESRDRPSGQRFLHHRASKAPWVELKGVEVQETAMKTATGGLADVRMIRPGRARDVEFAPHPGELVFGFVLEGSARIGEKMLSAADAFVIPPEETWNLERMSHDFQLLHLTTAPLDAAANWLL